MSTHLHERENLLPWHAKPWERLMKYVQRGRMPHALFLSGNSGVGKTLLVRQFANTLLCTGSRTKEGLACGRCSACTLFRAGTHPDFSVVAPKQADKGIAIDAIRELSAALALRAQYGGHRVVIISPAHRMTAAAANSLLKTLEEPVERTVIVLISHSPYIMPATILSRCQKIHIDLPSRSVAIQWLRALKITNDADGLLSAAMGAPLLAVELSDNACMARRQTLYETLFMEWATNPVTGESLPAAAEKWAELPQDQVLSWLTAWVIDIIRLKCAPEATNLFNAEQRDGLKEVAQRLNLTQLFGYLDVLIRAKSLLKSQVNKQLMLEELLIKWINLQHYSGRNSWQR